MSSKKETKFDNIRPYTDEEIPAAMNRIVHSASLPLIASFVFPDETIDTVKSRISSYKTIKEFQTETMKLVNQRIIEKSIDTFTCSGLEYLDKNKSYLYVSNHRDIMLDSSLLQYYFVINGFDTTEITFGANLMMSQLIIDIGKSNKMFKVERPGGSIKEFYKQSLLLSEYIRHTITEKKQSVWIAQRNGRTKDGNDTTDQGIIKMFCMSEPDNRLQSLSDLNIVPISVSYEWESCDILKALELYESQFTKYTKKPGEDLNSILTGILSKKGNVHFEICKPISVEEILSFENQTNNEFHSSMAKLLDSRIRSAYKLFPNNYIAHDIRYGNTKYKKYYTTSQKQEFIQHMKELERFDTCELERLKDIFLGIYSNPVDNK